MYCTHCIFFGFHTSRITQNDGGRNPTLVRKMKILCGTFGCTLQDRHAGLHKFTLHSSIRKCAPAKHRHSQPCTLKADCETKRAILPDNGESHDRGDVLVTNPLEDYARNKHQWTSNIAERLVETLSNDKDPRGLLREISRMHVEVAKQVLRSVQGDAQDDEWLELQRRAHDDEWLASMRARLAQPRPRQSLRELMMEVHSGVPGGSQAGRTSITSKTALSANGSGMIDITLVKKKQKKWKCLRCTLETRAHKCICGATRSKFADTDFVASDDEE